ncbi:hypothetical protein PCANC_18677 [Puccinia coronata f. sp. avenae]|uniref:DNA 3'-5' helicase n=1 Tax=Puccinia coronata f. sp. avenae TaxID=200324 RepID=A0A2N5VC92_9BASI|nr:hypothetical protein PCANC_18677 [Puccinia coronata f. sp. avenae]
MSTVPSPDGPAEDIGQSEGSTLCPSHQSLTHVTTEDLLPFEEGLPDQNRENLYDRSTRTINTKAGQLTLNKAITGMDREKTIQMLVQRSKKNYGEDQPPKEVQLNTVIDLIHLRDTFVLAGTGVGKSRIAEMYWDLFPRYKKPIVLVLNPLDSLGDNQSPEVLLNNAIFNRIFFNEDFQNRVSLVVVDEAHMIYVWGLVASGKSEKLFSHGRHQDRGQPVDRKQLNVY